MTIGILTFHNADNYGAVLQCYALQEYLRKKNPHDDVFVINYRNEAIERSYKLIKKRESFVSNITQFIYLPKNIKKRNAFKLFRKKFLILGEPDFSKYDVIYYGSDQIWNTNLTDGDLVYFGKGFSGKKIAYGASDGGELLFNDEIKNLINSFTDIFCREQSLADKLKMENIMVPVSTVLDPVFLLTKDEWKKIAVLPKMNDYILAYKVSSRSDFDEQVEKLGIIRKKPIIQIVYIKPLKKILYKKQYIFEGVSPEEFIGYFCYSDNVVTTSFHGTAFSIIFNKAFYVLKFEKRTERITDLLKHFGYEKRFIDDISKITMGNK